MAFGDTLSYLYQNASKAAQSAFNAVAKTTDSALEGLERGYEYTKDKALDAYVYGKETAGQAYEYDKEKAYDAYDNGKEKAVQAYDYGKEKAYAAYDYGKEKAGQAKDYAIEKYDAGKKAVGKQVAAAKQAVDKKLKPQPAGAAIQSCPNQSKAERVKARAKKINDSKEKLKNMPPGLKRAALAHATERLERNNYAVERAADTYNVGQGDPPEGWERVGQAEMEKLGVDTKAFPQSDPEFRADEYNDGFYPELYKSKADVFGEETYVLGLRGAQGKTDWLEGNAKQAVGMKSAHYEQAKDIARNIQETLGGSGKKFEIAGHSLGDGMTTAASIVSGAPGFAFDPAGVHPNTLESAGAFSREMANQLMQTYYTKGELLTTLQDSTVQRGVMATGVSGAVVLGEPLAGGVPTVLGLAATGGRALKEKGTLTYGAAGPMYEVPALANAHEVAQATAKGESIQGISPGLSGRVNNRLNSLQKVELHDMDYAIAGMEQQKADDLAVIDRGLNQ